MEIKVRYCVLNKVSMGKGVNMERKGCHSLDQGQKKSHKRKNESEGYPIVRIDTIRLSRLLYDDKGGVSNDNPYDRISTWFFIREGEGEGPKWPVFEPKLLSLPLHSYFFPISSQCVESGLVVQGHGTTCVTEFDPGPIESKGVQNVQLRLNQGLYGRD